MQVITIAHTNIMGRIINVSVWAADPHQDGLIPIPDGLPVGIGHYYRNDRWEYPDGTEIVMPPPTPEPEPPTDPYERIAALEQQQTSDAETIVGLYEQQIAADLLIANLYEQLFGGI